jgi:hypothetical protein
MPLRRWAIVLALPLLLAAKKHKKPEVEIWPPPAPGTDQAGEEIPKPKPQPKPVDAGDPYALDPELTAQPKSGPALDDQPAKSGEAEDTCADAFDDCKEDCAISHSQDDTLHVQRGKKLPVEKCLTRCKNRLDTCEEQHEAGFEKSDGEKPPDRD